MTGKNAGGDGWRGSPCRTAAWFTAAAVLILPLVAMQFTDEVNWTGGDFVFAGVLLFGSLGALEAVMQGTGNASCRAAAGIAILGVFLLTWSNAAVGITDSEADFYILFGVPSVAIIGAILSRLRPRGMALAMAATALAQAFIAVTALVAGIVPDFNPTVEILGINGFFVALFLGSSWLFRIAARQENESWVKPAARPVAGRKAE